MLDCRLRLIPLLNRRPLGPGGSYGNAVGVYGSGLGVSNLDCALRRKERGIALVVVLAMLVLMLGMALAFFSLATQQRGISASSAANARVSLLALAAEELIVGDLVREMEAGSEVDSMLEAERKVLRPLTRELQAGNAQEPALRSAPSMVPQLSGVVADAHPLVKVSRRATPSFQILDGYRANADNGPIRAAEVSSVSMPPSGRPVSLQSWLAPQLLRADAEGNSPYFISDAQAPDWVYLSVSGETPVEFSDALKSRDNASPEQVVGRFSYAVYDVGGLLDVNQMGNPLGNSDVNAARGFLHQVNPAANAAGLDFSWLADLVDWRMAESGSAQDLPEILFDFSTRAETGSRWRMGIKIW